MTTLGAGAALAIANSLLGIRFDPYLQFNFLVAVEGMLVGEFSQVSGIGSEVEFEEYQEGGVNDYTHKLPTRAKYPQNLVLERGLTDFDFLWAWHHDIVNGKFERKNGTIFLLDRYRIPATWWNFTDAYPVKWTGPQLQASSNAIAVESVELAHHGLVKPLEARLWSAGRAAASTASQIASKVT